MSPFLNQPSGWRQAAVTALFVLYCTAMFQLSDNDQISDVLEGRVGNSDGINSLRAEKSFARISGPVVRIAALHFAVSPRLYAAVTTPDPEAALHAVETAQAHLRRTVTDAAQVGSGHALLVSFDVEEAQFTSFPRSLISDLTLCASLAYLASKLEETSSHWSVVHIMPSTLCEHGRGADSDADIARHIEQSHFAKHVWGSDSKELETVLFGIKTTLRLLQREVPISTSDSSSRLVYFPPQIDDSSRSTIALLRVPVSLGPTQRSDRHRILALYGTPPSPFTAVVAAGGKQPLTNDDMRRCIDTYQLLTAENEDENTLRALNAQALLCDKLLAEYESPWHLASIAATVRFFVAECGMSSSGSSVAFSASFTPSRLSKGASESTRSTNAALTLATLYVPLLVECGASVSLLRSSAPRVVDVAPASMDALLIV